MSVDPSGNRVVESSAWIERMAWRTVCMVLFVIGLVAFVMSDGQWIYLALVIGGLIPGLFLMAREQGERHIEAQRRALAPEPRHDELPDPPGGLSGAHRPVLHAPVPAGYRNDPVPYGGTPYDDADLADDGAPMAEPPTPVVPYPTDLDPGTDNGRGNPPIRSY
jgi:hypothetical protein